MCLKGDRGAPSLLHYRRIEQNSAAIRKRTVAA
jgi:hypothetical protein